MVTIPEGLIQALHNDGVSIFYHNGEAFTTRGKSTFSLYTAAHDILGPDRRYISTESIETFLRSLLQEQLTHVTSELSRELDATQRETRERALIQKLFGGILLDEFPTELSDELCRVFTNNPHLYGKELECLLTYLWKRSLRLDLKTGVIEPGRSVIALYPSIPLSDELKQIINRHPLSGHFIGLHEYYKEFTRSPMGAATPIILPSEIDCEQFRGRQLLGWLVPDVTEEFKR